MISDTELLLVVLGVLVSYALVGWLIYYLAKVWAVFMYILGSWSGRMPINEAMIEYHWNCYDSRGHEFQSAEILFTAFWPFGLALMVFGFIIGLIGSLWRRYAMDAWNGRGRLKLRPSWFSVKKLISIINRAI